MRLRGLARQAAALTAACFFTIGAAPAIAQNIPNTSIPVDDALDQAFDLARDAVQEWASKGKSGGASSAMMGLLTESDTVICRIWIISFERVMTLYAAEAIKTPEGFTALGRMQQLRNRIEVACQTILNGDIGSTGGGGGTGEGGGPPTPQSSCPECDAIKAALDQAQWRVDSARLRAERARARTASVTIMWTSDPQRAGAFVETVAEAERAEDRAYEDLQKAEEGLKKAQENYDSHYEDCMRRCKAQQVGWLDRNKRAVLIAAAALTTGAFVIGGGDAPVALATPPVPVANTPPAPPVQTTPAPTPAPAPPAAPSPAGTYRCSACSVMQDIDRHELVLRFCIQLVNAFALTMNSPLRIAHPAPWVATDGEYNDSNRTYVGTGTGPVASFQGVSSRVQATFQQSGDSITGADLIVTLGENGVFPGGRPVTYSVRLTRQ